MHNGLINDLNSGGLNVLAGEPTQAIRQLRSMAAYYLFFALIMVLLGSLGSDAVELGEGQIAIDLAPLIMDVDQCL